MRGRFNVPNRRFFIAIIVAAVVTLGSCSEDSKITDPEPKHIETPSLPTGLNSARPGMAIRFCVDDGGGGSRTEYQWDRVQS